MKEWTYTIQDAVGMHARPAGLLVKEAQKFSSQVTVHKDGKAADAKKLLKLMGLGVSLQLPAKEQTRKPVQQPCRLFFRSIYKLLV